MRHQNPKFLGTPGISAHLPSDITALNRMLEMAAKRKARNNSAVKMRPTQPTPAHTPIPLDHAIAIARTREDPSQQSLRPTTSDAIYKAAWGTGGTGKQTQLNASDKALYKAAWGSTNE